MKIESKLQSVLQSLHLPADPKILEVGCGWGGYSEQIRKAYKNAYLIGFEKNEGFNNPTHRMSKTNNLSELRLIDFNENLKLEEFNSYDLVTIGAVGTGAFSWLFGIHTLEEYQIILQNMALYLKKGGHLFIPYRRGKYLDLPLEIFENQFAPWGDLIEITPKILSNIGKFKFEAELFVDDSGTDIGQFGFIKAKKSF